MKSFHSKKKAKKSLKRKAKSLKRRGLNKMVTMGLRHNKRAKKKSLKIAKDLPR